VSEWADS